MNRPLRITVSQDLGVLALSLGALAIVFLVLALLTSLPAHVAVITGFVAAVIVGNLRNAALARHLRRELEPFDDLLCPDCRYPLHPRSGTSRCTECGRAYEVDDVRRYWLGEACDERPPIAR